MTREEIFELARKCGAPDWWAGATDSNVPGGKWLTYFFHAAQRMKPPTPASTVNFLPHDDYLRSAQRVPQAPIEEPELPEPVIAREEYAVGTGEFYTAAQMHAYAAAKVRAGMVQSQDEKRLDWLTQTLFMSRWNGVIDSGSKVTWSIAPDYRHTTLKMTGNTLREAIDSAMQGGQK